MFANVEDTRTIRAQLLTEMKSGAFASSDRLPPENVLSEQLGISRTQLRDTLSALEREGLITRRHGIGTVINHHVVKLQNRMDIATEFLDIIRQSGYEPAVAFVRMEDDFADEKIAKTLHIPVGTEVVRVCRLCTADGKPAIYCEDVLDKELLKEGYSLGDLERPIYIFLQNWCEITAHMDLIEVHAVLAQGEVAKALEVTEGTPVLNLEEVDYDIEGKPIFCSSEYFVDHLFQQVVLRKKL